jgi:hypothetical protein
MNIIAEIRASFTSHPVAEHIQTGCIVLDDFQWGIYKKSIAKLAKERKPKAPVVSKKKVRDRRDMDIEAIEITSGLIYRICERRFSITKFENIEEIASDPVYRSHVYQALRGDSDRFDGYFWTIKAK